LRYAQSGHDDVGGHENSFNSSTVQRPILQGSSSSSNRSNGFNRLRCSGVNPE
jgi:hypothetical protein